MGNLLTKPNQSKLNEVDLYFLQNLKQLNQTEYVPGYYRGWKAMFQQLFLEIHYLPNAYRENVTLGLYFL